ncbi:4-coumarate--CoA ligase-like 9 [Vicia villosa]|uniref:4-coumarate--CoA ligase-like 9 n=1 Tax=Vicia villosa TaxID=3911 RepID=UPI00273BBCE4|nr:4-coumarate--CoA ligase-like 9 [Vicia villosa]
MEEDNNSNPIDPKTGFNSISKTFHSLRPPLNLPPPHASISAATYILSLRHNSPSSDSLPFLIDSTTSHQISHSSFIQRSQTLATNLTTLHGLTKNHTALVLSPNIIQVPILYFALLSIGVVLSPVNPASSPSEISHLISLSKPIIAFTTSFLFHKLPKLSLGTILIDSPEFDSLTTEDNSSPVSVSVSPVVNQSDVAAILYSSGTTGKSKGVMLTHRNIMASVASYNAVRIPTESPAVCLAVVPYFHVYGFTYLFKSVAMMETLVVMERFGLEKMLRAFQRFRVTNLAAAPPVVVAMNKERATEGYDLSSLKWVACGGAPLGKDNLDAFKAKFPQVSILQGYGLTESTAGVIRIVGSDEASRAGTTGRLGSGMEAKIVNPNTGESMSPGEEGELWVRGPQIMKGYVDDPVATAVTFVDGWLRTGDICYFDNEGFVYVVDRLKELIKYKGYQVAPAELEQLLQSHQEIKDAAVVPYPDEDAGQVPLAIVVRQPQSCLGEAEIIDFVAKQVAPYKKIRRVVFVHSIPKNASGKILRKELLNKILAQRTFPRL